MKIKLIQPPHSFLHDSLGMLPLPPLGIASLSSFLKQNGHEVFLDDIEIKIVQNQVLFEKFNEMQRKYTSTDLEKYLLKNKPNRYIEEITQFLLKLTEYNGYDWIGFSIIESTSINFALLMSKRIKKETNPKIVFGGDAVPNDLVQKYDFVDSVILGQGELKLLNLISKNNSDNPYLELPMDKKPIPDFEGLPMELYRNIPEHNGFLNLGKQLVLPYVWGRGCPYKCTFCVNSNNDFKVVPNQKSAKQVFEEMKILSEKYNTKNFFILNQYIHMDYKHTVELCNYLIESKLDLKLCGSARCNIEPDLITLLAKAGCVYIGYGMESGSNNILRLMRKGYTNAVAEKTLASTHNNNIWNYLYLIVKFPGESENDFLDTFDLIHKNIIMIDQITVSAYKLLESAVLNNPLNFGIQIREMKLHEKNNFSKIFSYDEIGGSKWEEIQRIGEFRLKKLRKLFYIHKKIPDSFLRADTHLLFDAYSKFNDKTEVWKYIKEEYYRQKSKEKAVIYINNICNNNCHFCKTPHNEINNVDEIKKEVNKFKDKGIETIIISGGEPTMEKYLFEVIDLIQKNMMDIVLHTNARMLSYWNYAQKLFQTGVRTISVPIYNNDAIEHDNITKSKGSFEQAINGINNWKELGGNVEIRTGSDLDKIKNMSDYVDFVMELETNSMF